METNAYKEILLKAYFKAYGHGVDDCIDLVNKSISIANSIFPNDPNLTKILEHLANCFNSLKEKGN